MTTTAGFIPVNIVPAPPVPPPITLYDACIHPPADEQTLDGQPMADTATLADGTTAVRGYRWEGGFAWLPRRCPPISGRNECAPNTSAVYRTAGDTGGKRLHMPVILETVNPCLSMMANDYPFQRQATMDALVAGEPVAAEQELWDGTLARAALTADSGGDQAYAHNRWLTQHGVATDLTPTPGTGVSPQRALQLLEDFLGATGTGGRGMIHFTPGIPSFLNYDLHPSGNQLLSARNTLIVPASGYSGKGPAATAYASRTVTDGVLNGTTTVTSATANFVAGDVGKRISGPGIPAGATITVRGSATSVTISAAATASGSGRHLTVYGGGDPATPAAGTVWAYATDQVTYRQGEIQVFPDNVGQALNRSTNSLSITAQRSVAATWDLCAVGAVLIQLPA